MFWPLFLGGAASIPAGAFMERWLPQPVANGVGFFLAWVLIAGLTFSFFPPTPKWNFWRWSVCGGLGALVGATVTHLVQN